MKSTESGVFFVWGMIFCGWGVISALALKKLPDEEEDACSHDPAV
jgi:hypothetical protein